MLFLAPGMPGSWFDGWTGPGGRVHFAGEGGSSGTDQRFLSGNRSIRDHHDEGRELRLFHCAPHRLARYIGRFRLDPDQPHFRVDAPVDLRRPHDVRSIIVFRLQPLDGEPTGLPLVHPVAVEKQLQRIEPAIPVTRLGGQTLTPNNQRDTERLHARYTSFLRSRRGADVTGYRIAVPGTNAPLHAELVDLTAHEVIVTRVTTARTAIWQALGELDDLARHINIAATPRRVLLLPAPPDRDLADLLASRAVIATWPTDTGFERTAPK